MFSIESYKSFLKEGNIIMKKIISVFVAAIMLVTVFAPAFSASASSSVPSIMIRGRDMSAEIYNKEGKQIYPVDTPAEYIEKAVAECLPLLGYGLLTDDLDPWAEKVTEFIAPIYKDVIADKNGEITNGSHTKEESGRDTPLVQYGDGIEYMFNYDWRRDIFSVVDSLQDYILNIMDKTGCKKVNLIGRCYGGSIIEAYLSKYGHEYVDMVVFYCSTHEGSSLVSGIFSGQFNADPKEIEKYLEGDSFEELLGNETISEILKSTVMFLNSFYGLNATTEFLSKVVNEKLYPPLAKKMLPVCMATYTTHWAMCDTDSYAKGRKLVFDGQEEEYAGLLEKTDAYNEIQKNFEKMITQYVSEGMKIAFVVKYNSQFLPFINGSEEQGDDTVSVKEASLGATAARYGSVLSSEYLKTANMKHVSSDHIIDASTCLFPEYTWFIKDLPHNVFPWMVHAFIGQMCNYDGQITVDSLENFPQFLKYNGVNVPLTPLTDEPVEPEDDEDGTLLGFIKAVIKWVKTIFSAMRELFLNAQL